MALSDVSATCSIVERLQTFVTDTGRILAEDKESGVIVVTDLVVMRCSELADMQGGAAVVIGAEAEGQVYSGFMMDKDVVLVLCESAQGTYVLRAVRVSV